MAKLEYTDSSGQKHTLELTETGTNDQTNKLSKFYMDHLRKHDVLSD